MTWRNYREYLDFKQVKRGPWVTFEARSHLRDSDRSGEAVETGNTDSTEGESAVAKPIAKILSFKSEVRNGG